MARLSPPSANGLHTQQPHACSTQVAVAKAPLRRSPCKRFPLFVSVPQKKASRRLSCAPRAQRLGACAPPCCQTVVSPKGFALHAPAAVPSGQRQMSKTFLLANAQSFLKQAPATQHCVPACAPAPRGLARCDLHQADLHPTDHSEGLLRDNFSVI
jgi:hypothetical protein